MLRHLIDPSDANLVTCLGHSEESGLSNRTWCAFSTSQNPALCYQMLCAVLQWEQEISASRNSKCCGVRSLCQPFAYGQVDLPGVFRASSGDISLGSSDDGAHFPYSELLLPCRRAGAHLQRLRASQLPGSLNRSLVLPPGSCCLQKGFLQSAAVVPGGDVRCTESMKSIWKERAPLV